MPCSILGPMPGSKIRSHSPVLLIFGLTLVSVVIAVSSLLFRSWDRVEDLELELLEAQLRIAALDGESFSSYLWELRELERILDEHEVLKQVARYHPAAGLAARTLETLLTQRMSLALDPGPVFPAATVLHQEIARVSLDLRQTMERLVLIVALLVLVFLVLTISLTSRLELEQQRRAWDRRTTSKLINWEESIRKHLARELHDDLAQDLALARISTAEENRRLLANAIQKIRKLTRDLSLPKLSALELPQSLENLVESYRQYGDFQLDYAVQGSLFGLENQETNTQLYRIIQELLQNAFKHSKAQQVSLYLHVTERILILRYADDGVGISQPMAKDNEGSGLRNIKDRAKLMRAKLDFTSRPGEGLHVELILDLRRENDAG